MSRHLDKCINKRVISHLRKQSVQETQVGERHQQQYQSPKTQSKGLTMKQASQRGAQEMPGSRLISHIRSDVN